MKVFTAPLFLRLVAGLGLSLAIGGTGYRRGVLGGSGVIGAVIPGTLVIGLGGWTWAALLIAFFVSSSALSGYRAQEKEPLGEEFAKGEAARALLRAWDRGCVMVMVSALLIGLIGTAAGNAVAGNLTGTAVLLLALTGLYFRSYSRVKVADPLLLTRDVWERGGDVQMIPVWRWVLGEGPSLEGSRALPG